MLEWITPPSKKDYLFSYNSFTLKANVSSLQPLVSLQLCVVRKVGIISLTSIVNIADGCDYGGEATPSGKQTRPAPKLMKKTSFMRTSQKKRSRGGREKEIVREEEDIPRNVREEEGIPRKLRSIGVKPNDVNSHAEGFKIEGGSITNHPATAKDRSNNYSGEDGDAAG